MEAFVCIRTLTDADEYMRMHTGGIRSPNLIPGPHRCCSKCILQHKVAPNQPMSNTFVSVANICLFTQISLCLLPSIAKEVDATVLARQAEREHRAGEDAEAAKCLRVAVWKYPKKEPIAIQSKQWQ